MKRIFIIVFATIISSNIFAQSSFYVSTAGNNSNDGSFSSPWQTIQFGVDQLSPADTLFIRGGSYSEKIDIDVSGSPSAYITIKNYQNEEVIINAIRFSDDQPIIWTDNAYLQIEGLHLTNNIYNYASGLALQGTAHHIKIINNKISNIKFSSNPDADITPNTNAVPLSIYADHPTDSIHDIIVKGNEVFNNQTGYSENIAAGGNFSNFEIVENTVHDNTNIGIDIGGNYGACPTPALDHGRNGIIKKNLVYNCNAPYSTAAGIYIDGGINIIVENNVCHHNGYGGEIGCEEDGTTENILFRNNIFYQNEYAGMHVGGYDVNTTGIVKNSAVYNNSFFQNDTGNNYNGEMILTLSDNCTIENNIFYLSSQNVYLYFDRNQTNLSLNYNLVYAGDGSKSIEVTGTVNTTGLQNFHNTTNYGLNSSFGNPRFSNPQNADFHILSNSPAINAGNPSYIASIGEVDIDGQIRVYDEIIDCGADEYGSYIQSVRSVYNRNLKYYPNPSNDIMYIDGVTNFIYKIYSNNGQLIKLKYNKQNSIDLTDLKAGLYLVQIYTSNGEKITVIKVVKK